MRVTKTPDERLRGNLCPMNRFDTCCGRRCAWWCDVDADNGFCAVTMCAGAQIKRGEDQCKSDTR